MIAEVGPLDPGGGPLEHAGLDGTVFAEILGNQPQPPALPGDRNGICFSYAGHALHTTSPETLRFLKAESVRRNKPFSFHLAESEAESEFLERAAGSWADLLIARGIDFSAWDLKSERPVERARRLGLLGPATLAVHVLDVTRAELGILADSGTKICLCPRSNFALHGRLPNFPALAEAGFAPCLGTDSLAGVPSLSLFDEMGFIAEKHPEIRPQIILAIATVNGAKALGRPDWGSLEPGKRARFIYVDLEAKSAEAAAHVLVWDNPDRVEWI
jgi:cytosine/adenosine deaminase-related metal-dependent hydrolase